MDGEGEGEGAEVVLLVEKMEKTPTATLRMDGIESQRGCV